MPRTPYQPLAEPPVSASASEPPKEKEPAAVSHKAPPAYHSQLHPQKRPSPPPAAAIRTASPTTTASTTNTKPTRPPSERRRLTLTSRFPLLRKASREVTSAHQAATPSVPSIHIRGTSVSLTPPSPADSPFLATGAPRSSTSSSARGRFDRHSDEVRLREPSSESARQPTLHEVPDNASTHSATSLLLSATSRAASSEAVDDDEPAARNPDQKRQTPDTARSSGVVDRKMHQTSSRLLRMTDDERPFTTDFKDLFSTLMVSLPLTPHRVRFRMIDYTFTSDEAITNLGSLKFSQSNRMPDPKDSSRVVTTTTTTTFSMAKEMARSVCQKFFEAKFIESVEGKFDFQSKNSVWQLSPKGIHILERFCSRNGIQSAHVKAVIESARNPHQLVILERDIETDKLHHDEQTVEIIFRRFVGASVNESTSSDADSIHEFSKCDVGVRMIKHRPTQQKPYEHVFNGKNTAEWLMDCCTTVDRREAVEVGELFLAMKLIALVESRGNATFVPAKNVLYYVTPKGEQVAGWTLPDEASLAADASAAKARDGSSRDSNSNRTNIIIRNPSWRLLYREFLKETMCEENLSFYLEVQAFNSQYQAAVNTTGDHKIETIRETLAAAYGLYNAFLAPGSPNELNIDHALRTQLATRMTRAVGDDAAMMQSLVEVASLFEKAQNSIFKLMSSDSVPKFIKHPKYGPQLRGLDAAAASAYGTQAGSASRT